MHPLRFLAVLAGFAAAVPARVCAEENVWPVRVAQTDDAGRVVSWQAAGPLIFQQPAERGGTVSGFRPLFAEWQDDLGQLRERNVLYPVFIYRTDGDSYRWSVFQLINRSGNLAAKTTPTTPVYETFDLWPFWFSRDTGDPQGSYRALFPIAGTIKDRFGYDRLKFTLFPFYLRSEKKGTVATSTPWPFLKITRGRQEGFALWPLYGRLEQPGVFERRFYLWPLAWNNTIQPRDADGAPVANGTPRREVGVLPFYTRETAPGFDNANFLWPFFGYTDRTQPNVYHETRYFWPFLVRGEGENRDVRRFGPFYTHSVVKGVEKTWYLWPIYRERREQIGAIDQTQRQVLYFLYRSTEQRSLTSPSAAPAEKQHLWPLFSSWDNGAGRQQLQFPSPLAVFFPDNERVRASWSPLFALYRFDQRAPDDKRHELLWGLFSHRVRPGEREFHVGPLFSMKERADEKRFAIGNGLIAWQRGAPGTRWRFFWFDFPGRSHTLHATSR